MSKNVRLTNTAKVQLENLLEYLEENWSQSVKLNFIRKLYERSEKLKTKSQSISKIIY